MTEWYFNPDDDYTEDDFELIEDYPDEVVVSF